MTRWPSSDFGGKLLDGPPVACGPCSTSVRVSARRVRRWPLAACACVCACVHGERRDSTARPRKSDGGDGGGNEKDGADGRREISERGLRHVRTIIALVGEGKIL